MTEAEPGMTHRWRHNSRVPYFQTFDPQADADAHGLIARIDALSTLHDVVHDGVRVRWRCFGDQPANGVSATTATSAAAATNGMPVLPTRPPPLVLLHGGHGSWMHWLRNVEALSVGRTLWVPDLPGYNESDAPPMPAPGQAPLEPLLDALAGSLDELVGAEADIDLGGFSFGGFVASQFAVRRGHVRRLALVGSGGHATLRRMTVEMINWRAAEDRDEERAALLHNLAALMLHDKAAIDPTAFAIHDISCHGTRFRSKEISLSGGLQEAIDTLGGPQLLLWGEHDVTADSRPLVAELVAGHPERQGVVVDGAGHWAQFERADAVNALLVDFLS